ncbi:MAG: hypothetical protein K0S29_1311 [Gammaproteobacteria bacterium]|jgi:hypothetical protein|nr:hypothetical protein [Gammaproteobacteria bacterium]
MFAKEEQTALEAANKIILDKIFKFQQDWFECAMSGFDLDEIRKLDALIAENKQKDAIFDKILANKPISQFEIDLLLADKDLEGHWELIKKHAHPQPVSAAITPCFITSRQQLSRILSRSVAATVG